MKANELRIGNLLLTNNTLYRKGDVGKVACIVAIDSEKSFEELKGTATIYHIENEYKDTYGQFLKYLQPIPLTEEWLVRFGFLSESQWNTIKEWFNIELKDKNTLSINIIQNTYCVGSSEWGEWTFPSSIYYVHQLQNLYFALTGEELTLKEEVKP